jgi:predicted Zn-dependent peptidase
MPNRKDKNYYTADLISDLLGRGNSSYLYQKLVKEKSILNDINVYITGEVEEGLLVISAKLKDNENEDDANKMIKDALHDFLNLNDDKINAKLQGVKNKVEATLVMNDIHILNRAMNLSFFEMMGDANNANKEIDFYLQVEAKQIMEFAQNLLSPINSTTLFYLKEK